VSQQIAAVLALSGTRTKRGRLPGRQQTVQRIRQQGFQSCAGIAPPGVEPASVRICSRLPLNHLFPITFQQPRSSARPADPRLHGTFGDRKTFACLLYPCPANRAGSPLRAVRARSSSAPPAPSSRFLLQPPDHAASAFVCQTLQQRQIVAIAFPARVLESVTRCAPRPPEVVHQQVARSWS